MGLNRLENFLKNIRGNVIYVDQNSLDATDSIENQGNSPLRPFISVQRALIEAVRFSYQKGFNNDRFAKTTIKVAPGDYLIDNRPGLIGLNNATFKNRAGSIVSFSEFNSGTNFDLTSANNDLYKLNSIYGGVIIPRGVSIIGEDYRKVRFRPTYIPDPENNNIETSAIFRLTGASYTKTFSILDANPNGFAYKDYTQNIYVPNFSHHKLTAFEYADGVNFININDVFQSYSADLTDLEMYYNKISVVFGPSSGREIQPDFPNAGVDLQPIIGEYEIVGSRGSQIGITSIFSEGTTTITAILAQDVKNIDVDTPIEISGIVSPGYNGNYTVSAKNGNQIQYKVSNIPAVSNPDLTSQSPILSLVVDTVKSSSPYIKEVALLSVYGMSSLHADGSKADGFRSIVVSEFTGISLQKDDKAFVKYNKVTGAYNESSHSDSRSRYKPSYENYHIKCSNGAFAQLVSIFAIGFANNFIVESGADQSVTGGNSNFGARSLYASGFKSESFPRDDVGFITHIIPPKEIESDDVTVEYYAVDINLTNNPPGIVTPNTRLYLYGENNINIPPDSIVEGYRIGARNNELINVLINNSGSQVYYSAKVVMSAPNSIQYFSNKKTFLVSNISANTINFTSNHALSTGESIRLISESGELPDNIISNQVYYAIAGGTLNSNQIRIAQTYNEAVSNTFISINNKGTNLIVESRVSDKKSGEIGHPVQHDGFNWYINVNPNGNLISFALLSLSAPATPRTYITRTPDNRNLEDRLYKVRYVIPKNAPITSRPPIEGYIIQESNNVLSSSTAEVLKYLSPTTQTISSVNELRNYRTIANATWSSGYATFTSEVNHNLIEGCELEISNIKSSNNTSGTFNRGYNGTFKVINVLNRNQFRVILAINPGTFQNDINIRNILLPKFKIKKYNDNFAIYKSEEIQEYIPNQKDGIYHITLINHSNSPKVEPFTSFQFSQPIKNLYPQINRDNPISDPDATICNASSDILGDVVVNDPEKSITKETIVKFLKNSGVGIAITNITSTSGIAHTVYTKYDHGFNQILSLSIVNSGSGYGEGIDKNYYNAQLVSATGNTATASIRVNSSGNITNLNLIDGGSSFSLSENLTVVGVASTTIGFIPAVVAVQQISNDINDSFTITGITGTYSEYNNVYRITSVVNKKQLNVVSCGASIGLTTSSLLTDSGILIQNGRSYLINSLTYDKNTGIGTIVTNTSNEFLPNDKIVISNFTNSFFNKEVIVKSKLNNNTVSVNFGKSSSNQSITINNNFVNKSLLDSQGGVNSKEFEDRIIPIYEGYHQITGNSQILVDDTTISIPFSNPENFNLGDYIIIDKEIMRISQTVSNVNSISVLRGLLGTTKTSHIANSTIRKIKIIPIETRRNSIMRVSSHTFEYVGYGPGNYSTTLPENQDRQLSPKEQINSQSLRTNGGTIIFSAINSDGDVYTVNTRVNASTGRDELYNSPIPTITGEDISSGGSSVGFDVKNPLEINVSRSISVEGGSDNTIISKFNGPVIFNNKLTSNSSKGIEASSLYLQGESLISRKYTVGISTPILAGNPGDVVFREAPVSGGSLGWVYTLSNQWEEFGLVKNNNNWTGTFYGTFVGDVTGINIPNYWNINSSGISTTTNLGIGTVSATNAYKFYVEGNSKLNGTLSVFGASDFNSSVSLNSSVSFNSTVNINNGNYLIFNRNLVSTDNNGSSIGGFEWKSPTIGNPALVTRSSIDNIYVDTNQTDFVFKTTSSTSPYSLRETFRVKGNGNVVIVGDVVCNSDIKLKENIKPIEDSLDKVLKLRGVEYDRVDTKSHQLGLIAQEVENVVPTIVYGDDTKSVSYNSLIPLLIESIKQLKQEIEDIKNNK